MTTVMGQKACTLRVLAVILTLAMANAGCMTGQKRIGPNPFLSEQAFGRTGLNESDVQSASERRLVDDPLAISGSALTREMILDNSILFGEAARSIPSQAGLQQGPKSLSSWNGATNAAKPSWLAPAKKIIKEFEGCRLTAYRCPAGVWTIGWGATQIDGRPVREGETISKAQADAMLRDEIEHVASQIKKAHPPAAQWAGGKKAALISWAFNVGLGAVNESTLLARLLNGEDPKTVVRQELPRWDKADGKQLAGLTRRRAAEVQLFLGETMPQNKHSATEIPLQRLAASSRGQDSVLGSDLKFAWPNGRLAGW